jgi:Mannosyl-glycoprotein endo-beta-N-acetylglucosaminidase
VAPSPDEQTFLARVRRYAPLAEARGVPGAVLVAQAVLESNWGRSGLARSASALYGIKATPVWSGPVYCGTTREWVGGKGWQVHRGTHRVYPSLRAAREAGCPAGALFRAYATTAANVRDYLQFFHDNPRYHPALRAYARSGDARRFAYDIAAAGYATAPGYGRRLAVLMDRYVPDLLAAPRSGSAASGSAVGEPEPPEDDGEEESGGMKISGAMIEALVKLLQGIGLLGKAEEEVEFRRAVADLEKTKAQVWVDFVRATSPDPNRVYVWANTIIALVRPAISTMVVGAMVLVPHRILDLVRTFGEAGPAGWIVMAPVLWWFFGRDVGKVLALRYGDLIPVGSGAADPRESPPRPRRAEETTWPPLDRLEEVDGQLGSVERVLPHE